METGSFIVNQSLAVNDALAHAVQRVQRSLVSIHNGRLGAGAGIIWRGNGIILTNNHVVSGRGPFRVSLADGREFPAELVARKPEADLALLRIPAQDLPPALIADSHALQVGQLVMALGHPLGERNFVTAGILSAVSSARSGADGSQHIPVLRSDVRLAPGNSGGPLVNAAGGVIGINTMIVGGDQGIAIPSHLASEFVRQTLDNPPATGGRGRQVLV